VKWLPLGKVALNLTRKHLSEVTTKIKTKYIYFFKTKKQKQAFKTLNNSSNTIDSKG